MPRVGSSNLAESDSMVVVVLSTFSSWLVSFCLFVLDIVIWVSLQVFLDTLGRRRRGSVMAKKIMGCYGVLCYLGVDFEVYRETCSKTT